MARSPAKHPCDVIEIRGQGSLQTGYLHLYFIRSRGEVILLTYRQFTRSVKELFWLEGLYCLNKEVHRVLYPQIFKTLRNLKFLNKIKKQYRYEIN